MAKQKDNKNIKLNAARSAKNDEFYTQLSDIERELKHYKKHFKSKIVLCNCDDPRVSNFFRYFYCKFCYLGIKKLISVCYKNLNPDLFSQYKDEQAVYCVYDGQGRVNDVISESDCNAFLRENTWQTLKGNGDFRSEECIELLKQADIVVTNPPFSLFREYVAQLMEYSKKFIIIGNNNAITYKEIFKLIKDNKLWIGYSPRSMNFLNQNGQVNCVNANWFTNLDVSKRHEELILYKTYNTAQYPTYDNYGAIEVSKVVDIPVDYNGVMGVPITFLDKYNPKQFEILGMSASAGYNEEVVGIPVLVNGDARPLINGKNTYARVFIKKRQE